MKGKTVWAVFCFFAILLIASGIHAEAPGITSDSVTVGAIIDMSGPVVHSMTSQYHGSLAYFEKAYREGIYKRKVKAIAEDGEYNPAKHLVVGKLLLDRDNVFCFINAVGTSCVLALNTLLEAREVPLVSHTAQAMRTAVPFKKYIFNQLVSYFVQARMAVDFIMSRDPKARIAIICQDDDFGQEGRDGFLFQCEKYGITPGGVVTYQRGAKDFSSPVLKLKSLNPNWVINHAVAPYGASVMKEAHKLGWKPNWVAISGNMGQEFIQFCGVSLDFAGDVYGILYNYPADGTTKGALEYQEAVKKYQPKADITNNNTMWGYGYAKILVEGLKRAEANNDLTREGLIKALETFRNFETGVFPPVTYTSTSHPAPDVCMFAKRQGPTWVPLTGEWLKPK